MAYVNRYQALQRQESSDQDDLDLEGVVTAWPGLPEAIKVGILNLVGTSVNVGRS
jgi:hypothetical protein